MAFLIIIIIKKKMWFEMRRALEKRGREMEDLMEDLPSAPVAAGLVPRDHRLPRGLLVLPSSHPAGTAGAAGMAGAARPAGGRGGESEGCPGRVGERGAARHRSRLRRLPVGYDGALPARGPAAGGVHVGASSPSCVVSNNKIPSPCFTCEWALSDNEVLSKGALFLPGLVSCF